jgi:anion-transporting  ArsA/GET3 family ATPase
MGAPARAGSHQPLDEAPMKPFDRRFLFVTGKGGVGKTSVAAGLARAASDAGRRVLLAATETESYRNLLPNARWQEDPTPYDKRLFTVHIQPDAALKEYGRLLIKPRLARQALFDNRYVQGFLAAVPGLPQWAVLGKAWYHTTEVVDGAPRFDCVIFDAPATGHGFEMLRLPKVITEVAPAGLLRRDADLAWQMLRDPERTGIVVVTLPEELPTNEALELLARIKGELELPIGAIVLNRVRPLVLSLDERRRLRPLALLEERAPGDGALRAAAARAIQEDVQLESSARLTEVELPLITLPDLEGSSAPGALLQSLAKLLHEARA